LSILTSTLAIWLPHAAPNIVYVSPDLVTLAGADFRRLRPTEVNALAANDGEL
jgi:hypothetical protein